LFDIITVKNRNHTISQFKISDPCCFFSQNQASKLSNPNFVFWFFSSLLGLLFLNNIAQPVQGQIVVDDTVETETSIVDNVTEITGGTTQGSNLFHSFQEFSVDTNNTAFFNNSTDIANIISRVTGESISSIDGLIRANGAANLILINPNGINFGANARLDIGGSFLGSTADSLIFGDGTEFSANDLGASPLLTVSAPVGLQLGQNSGAINVNGQGHDLSVDTPFFSPFNRGETSGLELQNGGTLGLVGSEISFDGGVLSSESGRVEIGSVSEGIVSLNFDSGNLSLGYENISTFQDINLAQRSLIDASGSSSGSIRLQGRTINLNDSSVALIQNFGNQSSGNLVASATQSISLNGNSLDGVVRSSFFTEALGEGAGGNIFISSPNLELSGGAAIVAATFDSGASGNLQLNISEAINLVGFAEINPSQFTVVSAQTFGSGNAGNIDVTTDALTIENGANIASVTGGEATGTGGDVAVRASESVELVGVNPFAFAPSQITAGSGSQGNAGNVDLQTGVLRVQDGGRVDASATASGNAGNLAINASESISVTGTVPDSLNPSLIIASANILDPQLRQLFGLPDQPSGNSGNISVSTPQLTVMDGGQITVRNDGTGDAGNIQIEASSINLNSNGGISGAVNSGTGGKIDLAVDGDIRLTSDGQIISDNSGAGDGGEIKIAANSLRIEERAFISTTSFGSGKGGNITLDINDSINIQGTSFEDFQATFQTGSLSGSLEPGTRGTGIFIGTVADGIGGDLEINTDSLSLTDGGIIFSPIFTNGQGGNISIETQDIEVVSSALQINAGIDSTNLATAGNIEIDTERLMVSEGGTIVNATFGDARGGDINIEATESVNLQFTPENSIIFTGIFASTSIGNGQGGNVSVATNDILLDEAFINSSTGSFINDEGFLTFVGGGDAGNINIEAAGTIEIMGIPPDPTFASGISATSFTDGSAGDITIASNQLVLRDGSEISATTLGPGNSGNITINTTESIELVGTTTINDMTRGGLVAASGLEAFPEQFATGSSGSIEINAEDLSITNGASIDVQSLNSGNAGNLDITIQDSLTIDNGGTISAATNVGTGGNIIIDAGNIFSRGNSTTTATASGEADGGNINIQGRNLVVLESSQFTAGASRGSGGNIDINTEGLFICNECVISASSMLGTDGVVNIDTLEPNSNLEIVEVPIKLTQPNEAIAKACSVEQKPNASKLIISGRGGLPNRPTDALSPDSIVSVGVPESQAQNSTKSHTTIANKLPAPAQTWYLNPKGEVVLTANARGIDNNQQYSSPDCHVR